jgi:hypothetical protein
MGLCLQLSNEFGPQRQIVQKIQTELNARIKYDSRCLFENVTSCFKITFSFTLNEQNSFLNPCFVLFAMHNITPKTPILMIIFEYQTFPTVTPTEDVGGKDDDYGLITLSLATITLTANFPPFLFLLTANFY